MAGSGMASDGSSIYVVDGNGTFGTTLNAGLPGRRQLRQLADETVGWPATASHRLFRDVQRSRRRPIRTTTSGSGGVMLLPDQTTAAGVVKHLAVAAGKDNHIYVVDRDSMGKFSASGQQHLARTHRHALLAASGVRRLITKGVVYYGRAGNDNLKALPIAGAFLATTASSRSPTTLPIRAQRRRFPPMARATALSGPRRTARLAPCMPIRREQSCQRAVQQQQVGTRDQCGRGQQSSFTPMIARGKVMSARPTVLRCSACGDTWLWPLPGAEQGANYSVWFGVVRCHSVSLPPVVLRGRRLRDDAVLRAAFLAGAGVSSAVGEGSVAGDAVSGVCAVFAVFAVFVLLAVSSDRAAVFRVFFAAVLRGSRCFATAWAAFRSVWCKSAFSAAPA